MVSVDDTWLASRSRMVGVAKSLVLHPIFVFSGGEEIWRGSDRWLEWLLVIFMSNVRLEPGKWCLWSRDTAEGK